MDYEQIRAEIADHGFGRTNETKKLEEFEYTNGQVIYLYKEQVLKEGVQIMIHPHLGLQLFVGMPGIDANAKFPLRSGSNMRHFPKRQSETTIHPISYGRSMQAANLGALGNLLDVVARLPATTEA